MTSALAQKTTGVPASTIAYIQSMQNADGGFRFSADVEKSQPSSLAATSAAIRALKYFGGAPENLATCRDFVASCFDQKSGGFADSPGGKASPKATSFGLLSALDLGMKIKPYSAPAYQYLLDHCENPEDIRLAGASLEGLHKLPPKGCPWLQNTIALQNADGSYGKSDGVARETGSSAVLILRLGGKIDNKKRLLKVLRDGQRSDGGFGKEGSPTSDLETSYRVMRAFMMLHETANSQAMQAFIEKCRNADGGYGFSPGKPSNVAATYFAGIIQHWLQHRTNTHAYSSSSRLHAAA